MSIQNNDSEKQPSKTNSNIESKFGSPVGRKTDISKLSENIKLLSTEINLHQKRSSMKANENIHEVIANLFEKDAQIVALANRKSIIHDLDFLHKETPQRMKNLRQAVKRKSSMPNKKEATISRTNSDKIALIKKFAGGIAKSLSKKGIVNNLSQKDSKNKLKFSLFDKSTTKIINEGFDSSDCGTIGEEEKDFLALGYSNTKKLKKKRIKSMEINHKKLSFYEKNLFHKQKKELAIEMLRNKLKNEKQNEFKEVPELSKKTKEIIKEKLNETKPLYQRLDEVIENKSNYMHNLKKFHNEESKFIKFREYNMMNQNTQLNELSNIDNFDYSNISRNPISNSVKNKKSNFNNKYLNCNKNADSVNNTFLKMLNDTNFDVNNITSIPAINTPNNRRKNETSDFENFKLDDQEEKSNINNKFDIQAYQEFLNYRNKKNNEENDKEKLKTSNQDRNSANKKLNNLTDFPIEEYVKYDIQYPQRTLDWIKNKERWNDTKLKRRNDQKELIAKSETDKLYFYFKPQTNIKSNKIVNAKKNLSRSLNMSQNHDSEEYKLYLNLNNEENIINEESKRNLMNHNMNKTKYGSQEKSVYENLYNRRFDSEIKRKKVLKEITSDFKPKINNDFKKSMNSSMTSFLCETMKNTKFNNIPVPKKPPIHTNTYSNKDENKIDFEENTLNKFSTADIKEKEKMILQMKRLQEKTKKKKSKGKNDEVPHKNAKQNLMDLLDEVEIENLKLKKEENSHNRRKVESNQLYKINIRSASAWDRNKENNVYFDKKFSKILTKIGMIKN